MLERPQGLSGQIMFSVCASEAPGPRSASSDCTLGVCYTEAPGPRSSDGTLVVC